MKVVLLILVLLACIKADAFDDVKVCLSQKCPDQYDACMAKDGCEETLRECGNKCGLKVSTLCWTLCIKSPGAAANAATCAANQKCLPNASKLDRLGLSLMSAIGNSENLQQEWSSPSLLN